ncbi:acyl carrier protein [Streptomyces sp. NPDC001816]
MDALVVDSMRTLMGNTNISIDANFMDVGGNSIIVVRLRHILSEELAISRAARIFFNNPALSPCRLPTNRPSRGGTECDRWAN